MSVISMWEMEEWRYKSSLEYSLFGMSSGYMTIILTPYKLHRKWDATYLVLSVIEFILNYKVILGGTTANSFSFFHGNVWHHFNNNKTLEEWVLMWLLHVYLILVENILLFTHSQKLLTIGVYCQRKNKFLQECGSWYVDLGPEDDWYPWIYDTHKLNLGSCENWAFGWRGIPERGTLKQNGVTRGGTSSHPPLGGKEMC